MVKGVIVRLEFQRSLRPSLQPESYLLLVLWFSQQIEATRPHVSVPKASQSLAARKSKDSRRQTRNTEL